MVKCKKSAPKALTDTGRLQKAQTEHLKNGPKRWVYHEKIHSYCQIHNQVALFRDQRNVLEHF